MEIRVLHGQCLNGKQHKFHSHEKVNRGSTLSYTTACTVLDTHTHGLAETSYSNVFIVHSL